MSDGIFVAVTIVFFAIAVWYLDGCRALTKEEMTKEEMTKGGNANA